jgi:transcriptional regulator with XRE-family HTH domain
MSTRTNPAPLAANLRRALGEAGMTQEQLAREIDCGLRVVQEWCGGRCLPRWPRLVRIARALDREPAWFYTEHDTDQAAA